jgi:YebC/PmpR family DNA-binding regulatory protein
MSGHNRWSQIKHQKGAADKKRSALFSKLLRAIAVAARTDNNPGFNPQLRTAIDKAKQHNVPNDSIQRAINRSSEAKDLEEVVVEAYGPGGVAFIIEAITDNTNRTISEIKHLLLSREGKIANQGSVMWSFEKNNEGEWGAKFPQQVEGNDMKKIQVLIEILNEHSDVQKVTTNSDI